MFLCPVDRYLNTSWCSLNSEIHILHSAGSVKFSQKNVHVKQHGKV